MKRSKRARRVTLAVSGSVAIYKACEVASQLTQKGCEVRVAMTRRAAQLVSPQLFAALSGQPACADEFSPDAPLAMTHIDFADCDLFLAAPASADLIGRLAAGLADDLVTTTALALKPKVLRLLAPAMNSNMWANALVQRNLTTLREAGWRILEPGSGYLACGVEGRGRLPDAEAIVVVVLSNLGKR